MTNSNAGSLKGMLYSFNGQSVGVLSGDTGIIPPEDVIVARPADMSTDLWYSHAGMICLILNHYVCSEAKPPSELRIHAAVMRSLLVAVWSYPETSHVIDMVQAYVSDHDDRKVLEG